MLEFARPLPFEKMSHERPRLPKGVRKQIRSAKSHLRTEIGLTHHERDSTLWQKTEEILIKKIGAEDWPKFAAHHAVLKEFFDLRIHVKESNSTDSVSKFQKKHDIDFLKKLSPAFRIILEIVGRF